MHYNVCHVYAPHYLGLAYDKVMDGYLRGRRSTYSV